jgi:Protein of unknown function (DUF2563)
MWVEPELLHSGGDVALGAGKRVLGGAQALSAAPIGSSIFGDFDAARSFHQRLSEHRSGRVEAMHGNHRTLTDIGQKVQAGSALFTRTEEQNTEDVSHITDA